MTLFLWTVVFIISMAVLIKASDYFTDASESVGVAFGIPPFIVGVTIVAIGTSIPELATSLIAAFKGGGATEFITANVIGSNIANIFLVVGVAAVLGGAVFVKRNLISLDLPILAMSTAIFIVFVMWDGKMVFYEGLLSLAAFSIYLWYVFTHAPKTDIRVKTEPLSWKTIAVLIMSVMAIYFGAKYTVDSVLAITSLLGLGLSAFVATVVALGTSLPELVVSIIAVRKKQYEMALGNVFGSNIFNILMITGIPALITPLFVSKNVLLFGLPFLGIATFLYIIAVIDREVKNYEGAMFLILYVSFVITMLIA